MKQSMYECNLILYNNNVPQKKKCLLASIDLLMSFTRYNCPNNALFVDP